MRTIFSLLLIFFTTILFAQKDLSGYKMLNGKIGNYPVTVHLHKAGNSYNGYYYYNNQQNPVYFSGEDTTKKGTIKLMAFADYNGDNELFEFTINKKTASGTWKKSDISKPLSFSGVENSYDTVTAFQYIYTSGSVKLRPKMQESPEAFFEESAVWPVNKSVKDIYLRKLIAAFYNNPNSNEEVGAFLLKNKKQFFADYIAEFKDAEQEEIEEAAMAYSFEETDKLMVVYQSPRIITFARYFYNYTGGAHGMYGTGFTSVDLISKTKIELDDILTDAGKKLLPTLLEKYFRKAYNLNSKVALTEGGLFENKIEASENFFVTGKGIGFCYNPYEIGPYAMGEIILFIPFSELQNGINPTFKKLL